MTACVLTLLMFTVVALLCAVEIRPNDLQVPIRYSAFGTMKIYRAQWYSELSFAGFAVLMTTLHTMISFRLYKLKSRDYAIAFQWLTVVMLVMALLFFLAVFRVISIVE